MINEVEGLTLCIGLLGVVNAMLAFVLLTSSSANNDSNVLAVLIVGGLSLAGGYALGYRRERR